MTYPRIPRWLEPSLKLTMLVNPPHLLCVIHNLVTKQFVKLPARGFPASTEIDMD
jgi:hypothetical protein